MKGQGEEAGAGAAGQGQRQAHRVQGRGRHRLARARLLIVVGHQAQCDDVDYGDLLSHPALLCCAFPASAQPDRAAGVLMQVEMGSTNVRVGSTIFGARDYSK